MLLAIDIGNTNLVIGCIENDKILFKARIATDAIRTSDQYGVEIKNMMEAFGVQVKDIDDCIISSVVPPVTGRLQRAIKFLTGHECMMVGPGMKTGLNVRIDDPGTLAGDIVVGSVAAMCCYGAPCIILDMGTATTISVINKDRAYLGGCICPGVRISAEALSSRAALLPGIDLDQPRRAIGKNTTDCMRSGIMLGAACMLDGMIERMEQELGERATVVATGGIARFVLPMCRREIAYDRNLLLKGLAVLYQMNRKG